MKQFGFTSYTSKEITKKVDYNILEKILTDNIDLVKFGDGIEKIYFVFIVLPYDNLNHDEEISFKQTTKRLLIRKRIPYEKVKAKNKEDVIKVMAQVYFASLGHLPFLNINEFDIERFIQKVEKLFLEKKWLEKANIA